MKIIALSALAFCIATLGILLLLGWPGVLWRTTTDEDTLVSTSTPNTDMASSTLEAATGTDAVVPTADTLPGEVTAPAPVTMPTQTPVATKVPATPTPSTEPLKPLPVPTPAALDTQGWKETIATVFWVGEGATADNDYIHNSASAWNEEWKGTFGGLDDPDDRCGYVPCAFRPKQSPFYVALPYNDLDDNGKQKKSAKRMSWYDASGDPYTSQMDGHWVAVRVGSKTCYGQVRDVGPFEEDDVEYVLGSATTARNTFDAKAGLDLSPAMRDCLDVGDVSTASWRFVDASAVPAGPWLSW